jgi:hypothetical protein
MDYPVGASLMFLAPGKDPVQLASADGFNEMVLTAQALLVTGWTGSPSISTDDEIALVSAPLNGASPTIVSFDAQGPVRPVASPLAGDGTFI